MTIACVILNYNDSNTTIDLLEKIRYYQTIDYIIIVDNRSTDDSYEKLKRYVTEKIHLLLTERNGGYGYGNNYGVNYGYQKLGVDYAIIANPDVFFTEDCIRVLKNTLIENDQYAIAAPVMTNASNKEEFNIAWKIPTMLQDVLWSSSVINKFLGSKILYDRQYFQNKDICDVEVVPGSFFMVDVKKMRETGMYDEDFFLYCEEKILGYKLKAKGYKTALLLKYHYLHKHSVTINKSFKSLVSKKRILLRSKLLFLKKYYKVTGLRLLLIKLFFKLTLVETYLISLFKQWRRNLDVKVE